MTKKIFFGNYKGGVGKTTSVFYIAKQFSEDSFDRKCKILMIDLDPQCSLSEVCMRSFNDTLDKIDQKETLNYLLDMLVKSKKYNTSITFDFGSIIKKCVKMSENVDFIPTSIVYSGKDATFSGLDGLIDELQMNIENNIFLLREIITMIENKYEYDFIFFDCPPSNNILTKSAFLISDYYVIPYISDNISVKGVEHYITTVDNIYDKYCNGHKDADLYRHIFGEKAKLLGLFECMRIRNENPRGNIGAIKDKKYKTVIKNLIGIQEALSNGEVSEETDAYKELAKEIAQDINSFEGEKK